MADAFQILLHIKEKVNSYEIRFQMEEIAFSYRYNN